MITNIKISNGVNVLMLAEDPNICIAGSNARKRMERYAELFDELHIVVISGSDALPVHEGKLFVHPAAARHPLLRRWRMYAIARDLAHRTRFDVITSQGPDEAGFLAYRISRSFGIRLQLQIHTDVLSPWYRKASCKEYLRYRLARFLLPRADCIRVVSERIRRSLVDELRIPESRITVLPIWEDLKPFLDGAPRPEDQSRFRNHATRLIAVGRFVDKEKNFSMLICLMADVVKQYPSAVLVLVGDGPDKKKYELRIKNYGLEKHVILEPWRNDLVSFYKCFDMALIPSNYEGWGLVALEAMASGLALVMTDVGVAGEIVHEGENGRVVHVGDEPAFRDAILDLAAHPEKRRLLAEAGRRTIADMHSRTEAEYLRRYKESFEQCV